MLSDNVSLAPGTWLARPAEKHDIVPDICNAYRTRCPYMKSNYLISYNISSISVKNRPDLLICRYCIRFRTRYRSKTFGCWWVAKTVKTENQARYRINFSSISKKTFDIGPNIEWQRRINLNIGPNIRGFFFDIEEKYTISKVYDDDIK